LAVKTIKKLFLLIISFSTCFRTEKLSNIEETMYIGPPYVSCVLALFVSKSMIKFQANGSYSHFFLYDDCHMSIVSRAKFLCFLITKQTRKFCMAYDQTSALNTIILGHPLQSSGRVRKKCCVNNFPCINIYKLLDQTIISFATKADAFLWHFEASILLDLILFVVKAERNMQLCMHIYS